VEVVPVSRREGVDVTTGQGLIAALRGADVVVDVTDAPSRAEGTSVEFFGTSTGNLMEAAAATGIEHYVALSVVGADRVQQGYFRAKAVQEERARRSPIPHSLVRAMPFGRPVPVDRARGRRARRARADPPGVDGRRRGRTRPCRRRAAAVRRPGDRRPRGVPTRRPRRQAAGRSGDIRGVVTDARAPFFGALVAERSLLPRATAHPGHETLAQWLARR
jgi:hypothetical protein